MEARDGSGARNHLSNCLRALDDRLAGEDDAGIACPVAYDTVDRPVGVNELRPGSIPVHQPSGSSADVDPRLTARRGQSETDRK
jgi:hypothetical protein